MDNIAILEALLYTSGDEGLEQKQIIDILDINLNQLEDLVSKYHSHGLTIQRYGSTYVLTTKKETSTYIEQLVKEKYKMKLSQAAMETLSIITYNQPLTRGDIEMIRGINSDGAVKTLIARGLVEAKDVDHSRSHHLITTDLFLNVFGIENLDALPTTEEDEAEMDEFFSNLVNQKGESTVRVLIENEKDHLSAEDVYLKVKDKAPEIGLATVYRTLELLAEIKVLDKINFGDGVARFDLRKEGAKHFHHHLVCMECGKVEEIEEDLLPEVENRVENEFNFKILDHRLTFHGVCSECQAKNKQ